MLLLVFYPQPPPASPSLINFSQLVKAVYPALNASGDTDLTYWTTAELYQYFDECSQRLSRRFGVFVEYDTTIAAVVGQGTYSLPPEQISTIQVDLGGAVLRARTTLELDALDANWMAALGPPSPDSFVQDTQGLTQIRTYPTPASADKGKRIGMVLHFLPVAINASNPYLEAPAVLQDYFAMYAIGEARAKETKAAMHEVSGFCRQVCALYEQTIEQYWGEAM